MELYSSDEEKCVNILRQFRWKGKITCVYCSSPKVKSNGKRNKFYHKYLCLSCEKSFTERSGTIFYGSKIPLNEWLYISKELKKNVPINTINSNLGREYKNVYRAAKKIMCSDFEKKFLDALSSEINVTRTKKMKIKIHESL